LHSNFLRLDLAAEHGGSLARAFAGTRTRFCLISFTSDWLFPTAESRAIVHALNAVAANVSFVEIATDGAEHRGLSRYWR
jgi:homoserine O-acetyltransferase